MLPGFQQIISRPKVSALAVLLHGRNGVSMIAGFLCTLQIEAVTVRFSLKLDVNQICGGVGSIMVFLLAGLATPWFSESLSLYSWAAWVVLRIW